MAKGDVNIPGSSGFSYTQDRKPSPDMDKPAPPRVSQALNNGELDCHTTTQPGMKSVNFYISAEPAAVSAGNDVQWDIISYNKVKYTFSGLTSGQRYFIKVDLVGVRGQEVISDIVI